MELNYHFVPEFKSYEMKRKMDIVSYAGMLLEIVGEPTIVVTIDEEKKPVIFSSSAPLSNCLDFNLTEY